MKKINKIITTIAVSLYVSATIIFAMPMIYNSDTVVKENEDYSEQVGESPYKKEFKTVEQIIEEKSLKYNLNPETMKKIIFCESSFNENSVHDGGLGRGIVGYHKNTFENHHSKLFFKATGQELNYNSTNDQIELMTFIFANYPNERFKWTSFNKLQRYGECNNGLIKKMGVKIININP